MMLTPVKDSNKIIKTSLIPPLTCVKEDNEEDEPSWKDQTGETSSMLLTSPPREETSTEKKGFFAVKQPSLVSTGNLIVPETITASSPDHSSYRIVTKFCGDSENIISEPDCSKKRISTYQAQLKESLDTVSISGGLGLYLSSPKSYLKRPKSPKISPSSTP